MTKILVTGGLGTIGAKLVANLRAKGNDVWFSDRSHHPDPKSVRCDVGEFRQLESALQLAKPDVIYHAAAEFGRWNGEAYYESLWRSNVVGTKHVLMLQKELGFKLIHFSSSEVYGDYAGTMSEDVMDNVEIKQLNDYAMTKWVNEQQILNAEQMWKTETVRIRIFNTYGPGEYYNIWRSVLCRFVYSAIHGLRYRVNLGHIRTHTYVDDAVEWISRIHENFKPGNVYNIAGTHSSDMKQLSDTILKVLERDDSIVDYTDLEPMTTKDKIVDSTRMIRDLGALKEVSLEEGVRRTINWQKQTYGV
jgi:dTDP-glucose 4,6-dehydratase